jgi:hypothetical protein
MVEVVAGACDSACRKQGELLSNIRSLLGRDGTRAHVVVLADEPSTAPAPYSLVADAEARRWLASELTRRDGVTAALDTPGTVLLDWRGQVVMHFATGASPGDIKADLKRLLRASAIR